VVGYSQAFSVSVDVLGQPNFISESGGLTVSRKEKTKGFNVSIDHRFYLAAENHYHAVHGLYIVPYCSFNHPCRQNTRVFDSRLFAGNTDALLDINIRTTGVEPGYQFAF
jgi:hypothetical protein